MFYGVIVNTISVIIGCLLGICFKRFISKELNEFITKGLGFCILVIGIDLAIGTNNMIYVIISLVIGGIIGFLLNFNDKINQAFTKLIKKISKDESENVYGFLTATMLVCIGSMAIIGSLESGINNDHSILLSKSVLDFFTLMVFAANFGKSTILSALVLLVYEGLLTYLSRYLGTYITEDIVKEMSSTGGIMLMMLGFNMIELTKIEVFNYILSPFIPIFLMNLIKLF